MSKEVAKELLDKTLFTIMSKPPSDESGKREFSQKEIFALAAVLYTIKEELFTA